MLLTQEEYRKYQSSKRQYNKIIDILKNNHKTNIIKLYGRSPSMIPSSVKVLKLKWENSSMNNEENENQKSQNEIVTESIIRNIKD